MVWASGACKERRLAWPQGRVGPRRACCRCPGVAVGAWREERSCQRTAAWDPSLDTTPPAPSRPLVCSWPFQALGLS